MEKWRDIPGYDGMYQVSSHGRVRSWKRHQGKPGKRANPLTLKQTKSTPGYLKVNLWKKGVRKTGVIHRLVAELFIPNPENKEYINHLDGDKHNNHVDNIAWCTASENLIHAYEEGLRPRGNMTKKKAKILKKKLMSNPEAIDDISKEFQITQIHAQNIIDEKVWAGI